MEHNGTERRKYLQKASQGLVSRFLTIIVTINSFFPLGK